MKGDNKQADYVTGTVNKLRPDARFQLLAVCSSWTRGHRANEPCLSRLQLLVLLKPGQRLIKNMKLVGGRSFPLKENSYFPGCNAVRFLLVGCFVEVADKKELLGLLFHFFGRNLHASWKQKSFFVMFSP